MTLPTNEFRRERYANRPALPAPPSPQDQVAQIKRNQKLKIRKVNEHFKLLASAVNSVSLAMVGGVTFVPYFADRSVPGAWFWIIVGLGLHGVAHAILRSLKSEDL